jgi:phosphonate transport system substrate-binding protein
MFCQLPRSIAAILAVCLSVFSGTLRAAPETYTFSVVPQFERRMLFNIWQPIIDELEKRTGHRFRLVTSLSVGDYEGDLAKGLYDFAYMNPYMMPLVENQPGYLPLVRDNRALHGILIVRKDSPVQRVEELQGKSLAVPSMTALGASLLLRAELDRKFGVRTNPVIAKTHSSVFVHVINGFTEAGGSVQKALVEQPAKIRDSLRVLYRTQDLPSHPVAAHKRVPLAVRESVRQALIDLSKSDAGRQLLDKVPMPEPVVATSEDYHVLRTLKLDNYLNP